MADMAQGTGTRWSDASGIPEPPWRSAPRSGGRAPLTREAIIEAALRVIDADGMDGLSMRRVGEELGTGAASIYWHVRNKEQLLQLVFERVVEEVQLPEPDPARWREQLGDLAGQMRAILTSHRDVARLSLGRIPSGPALAVVTEWLFTLLKPVGIPDKVIAYLGDLFALYVGAFAFEETLGTASFTGGDLSPEQFFAMLRDYVMSLPPELFPHTQRVVDVMLGGGPDERFAFGVDLMLRGLATYASQPQG